MSAASGEAIGRTVSSACTLSFGDPRPSGFRPGARNASVEAQVYDVDAFDVSKAQYLDPAMAPVAVAAVPDAAYAVLGPSSCDGSRRSEPSSSC